MRVGARQLAVIMVALMCLTALPGSTAGAGGGAVETPRNHTDFGTGDEPAPTALEGFSISGSGDSASISGPTGGTTKATTTASSGDTLSWSETDPSTSGSVLNLTGTTNEVWSNESGASVSPGSNESISVTSPLSPTGPSANGQPTVTITGAGTSGTYNPFTDEGDGAADIQSIIAGDDSGDDKRYFEAKFVPDKSGNLKSINVPIQSTSGADYGTDVRVYIEQENPDLHYNDHIEEGTQIATWDPDWSSGTQTINTSSAYTVEAGKTYSIEFYTTNTDSDGNGDNLEIDLDDSASSEWVRTAESGALGGNSYNRYANIGLEIEDTAIDVSAETESDSVTLGTVTPGESQTAEINLNDGDSYLNFTGSGTVMDYEIKYKERTPTRDPVVQLNGDPSQEISVDGTLSDGQTAIREIDNSWLESDNTATVTLNDSSLPEGSPPMEVDATVQEPLDYARYVSAEYTNLSQSDGLRVDWTGDGTLDATIQGWDGSSWVDARTMSTSQTGEVTLDYEPVDYSRTRVVLNSSETVEVREEAVLFTTYRPEIDETDVTPTDGGGVTDSPVELAVNVSDADFGTDAGDSMTVEFFDASDDSVIGSTTVGSNQTASTTWGDTVGGQNEWYAVATDSHGNEATTETFSFRTPSTLELRNESNPDSLVTTNSSVEVTFFNGETIIERSTTDGTVDMTGLPVQESFIVQVEADGYITRQAVIESVLEQQEVYLLPEGTNTVQTRFVLSDATGQFEDSETRVTVKRPLRVNNSTVYKTVVADLVGTGGYSTVLERDQRYLLEVTDTDSGQTRTLGPYVATASETVELEIDSLDFDINNQDAGYRWYSEFTNTTSGKAVRFGWEPTTATIEQLRVQIYNSADESQVILDQTYVEPDTISETAPIPSSVENANTTTWIVEWEAQAQPPDGGEVETIRGSNVVGPSQLAVNLPGVGQTQMNIVSVFLLLMVAGLFSTANVSVGGIVTSLFAGGLWFVGALPGDVTGILIGLALLVAVLWHVQANRIGVNA